MNIIMKDNSSHYINEQRREYGLYIIQLRAIPHAADGLKSSTRRVLWMARDGKKYKSATLAGLTRPIHPHDAPESAVNTLAAPYGNNIPLLTGKGSFGTLLEPDAFGASRYTEVQLSDFTKDVVFADIDIVPMIENYDGTQLEPKHFLPLVPIALVNPSEGIAIGFASKILPRSLKEIIELQIAHLEGKKLSKSPIPYFAPFNNKSTGSEETLNGIAYNFDGQYEIEDKSTLKITKLPYGLSHLTFINNLYNIIENDDIIVDYEDNSRDKIDITIKFKRGYFNEKHPELVKKLGLTTRVCENLNVINFDGNTVWNPTPIELIKTFTDWRFSWYKKRYERLQKLILEDIQKYKDILLAIKKNVGSSAKTSKSRSEFKNLLQKSGIVNLDYIADLPTYKYTEEEKKKTEEKLSLANKQLQEYKELLTNEEKRRKVYISELNEVIKKYT